MLFWILPIIFLVLSAFLALGWFFNTDTFKSIYNIFWFQMFIGGLGNLYLLPALMYCVVIDGSKDFEILQEIYLAFVVGLVIITAGKGLMVYRDKYIMVEKE